MKPKNLKPDTSKMDNQKHMKNAGFVVIVLATLLFGWAVYSSSNSLEKITLTEVITKANNGELETITEKGETLIITEKGGTDPKFESRKSAGSSLIEQGLDISRVDYDPQDPSSAGSEVWGIISLLLPVAIIIGFFMYMMKQAQGQGNQAMSFGKSKAKLFGEDTKEKVAFKEIAGNENSKEDLAEIVDFLKFPKKYEDLGAKIPKGVLLVGPPGTGKTMLARAVAGEAKVPFFSISGSEFVEMFVGVGASRVRDLFQKAKKSAPCIIFIDEIDAVGRKRGSGMGGGHDEREQTLNQILVEMDGFEKGANVIVLAATNRADVLDPALLRPGRFDRRVNINLPDRKDREAILKVHFEDKPTEKSVNLDALAAKTAGSSGADLANIANEAAILAASKNNKTINNDMVTEAFEKIAIGPERKSKVMSEHEKEMTAYHEAGHALVGTVAPDSDPVHKVTIIPRGGTGGVNWFIPLKDKSYHSIIEYKDILARALGGRIAEKLVYGAENVTTGAGSDLRQATDLARDMVIDQGMGTKLRNQVFHDNDGGLMFDKMTHGRPYSEDTARIIDQEVETLVKEAADRAEAIIKTNMSYLEKMKEALLEHETLEEKQVMEIFKGTKLPKTADLHK